MWLAFNYQKAQKWGLFFSRGPEYRLCRRKEEKTCRDLGGKEGRLGELQRPGNGGEDT